MSAPAGPSLSKTHVSGSFWTSSRLEKMGTALVFFGLITMVSAAVLEGVGTCPQEIAIGVISGGFVTYCIGLFVIERAEKRKKNEKEAKKTQQQGGIRSQDYGTHKQSTSSGSETSTARLGSPFQDKGVPDKHKPR